MDPISKTPISECDFFIKIQNNQFLSLINTCHQVQFKKNLGNRFRGKLSVDFRPKNEPLASFWS